MSTQVIILETQNKDNLSDKINYFLSQHEFVFTDISFSTTTIGGVIHYSALIKYKIKA